MGIAATLAFGTLGLLIAYAIQRLLQKDRNARPLPPGPKGWPVIGNATDMPKPGVMEYDHWTKHKDAYGPISSVTVLGQTIIILNDPKLAFELMRDRAFIHSGRPHQNFSCDVVGWKHSTAMCQHNDEWKLHRRNITKVTSSAVSVLAFDKVQEEEAARFLVNVLREPRKLFEHIRTEAGTVILKITYGYTARMRGRDPLVELAGKAVWTFAESTVPGKWAVDVFPLLKYLPDGFPGTAYRKTGREMAKILSDCVEKPYAFVKKQMREGRAKTSFLSQVIETEGADERMERIHKWAALSMFAAGADTTVSSLMTFFLAMTLYPDVQKKAQEELDRVVGPDRLPVAADNDSLPYIHAIMLETHRWHPVVPMGFPHTSDAEDVCMGYRIPKGAMLLPNTWWFTHDPAIYASPSAFNPSRFLPPSSEPDPRQFIFGYGRRICPGRYVADNALFITIAQTLAVFDILPTSDKLPEVRFEPGVVSHPLPYECRVVPRSEGCRRLVEGCAGGEERGEGDAVELEAMG
ncbi:cytochrome P450 [Paraphaeosphaeria sporulosa]|uniref:Cytochrome P450 n=1 Tax=Paraphaeosphaeria sporulosa TaxID=1460663 RepID=A0A177C1N6_9PLEO|nr:cytochrome P450 [Paraphaeosphaeria sporulosa]OAG01121.1 cytochrome P450 [Paraphaeosphaeria sporulosa]